MNSKYKLCHITRVYVILEADFMILTGIYLDFFNSTAKLPDELVLQLLKSTKEVDEQECRRKFA